MEEIILVKMDTGTYNEIIELLRKKEEHRKKCREKYRKNKAKTEYTVYEKNMIFEVYDKYQPQQYQYPLQNIIQQQQQQIQMQQQIMYQLQQQQMMQQMINIGTPTVLSS